MLVPGSDVLQELAGHDRNPRVRVLLLIDMQHPLQALLNPETIVVTTEDVFRKITGLRSVGGTPFLPLPPPALTPPPSPNLNCAWLCPAQLWRCFSMFPPHLPDPTWLRSLTGLT